ncbi:MAG: acyltransferase [Paenibacillaceae bacterium]
MGTVKKEQIKEIYIFRAIAILAVIMIHATSESIGKINKESLYYPLYNGLNMFSSFAVPTFIFLSGLVMFYTYYDRVLTRTELLDFYKKRLLYIVIPYIVISTFYFAMKLTINTQLSLGEGLKQYAIQLLTGGAYTHLYFMFLIIQFYLLFPLLLSLSKVRGVAPYLFLIGAALQWGYIFLNSEVIQYMDDLPNILHKRASLFPTYLAYYLLGATLGIYYLQFKKWFVVSPSSLISVKSLVTYVFYALWLTSGLYYAYIYYMGRVHNEWSHSKVYDLLLFIFSILSSIVLLHLSYWIMAKGGRKIVHLLMHLGIASFGVYFLHPAVLWFYRKAVVNLSLKHPFYYGGAFAIALIVSWLATALLMKFPRWSWIIIGLVPTVPTVPTKDNRKNGASLIRTRTL